MNDLLPPEAGLAPGVTLSQLRAFLAVARHGHVTHAAAELGLTQPAVSHQLRALESVLGMALIERVGRRVRLTTEGDAIVPAVAAALAAVRAVTELANARRCLHGGVLSIAASNTVGIYRLPQWLAGFVATYPGLEIRARMVNTAVAIELLVGAEVDCALIEGACGIEDLEMMTIDRDELVLVVSSDHPLAGLSAMTLDDLVEHRYLAREDGSGTEALAAELLAGAYRRGPILELDQVDAVRAGVRAGLGFAVLPSLAIDADLRTGRMKRLPLARAKLTRELRAVRRPRAHGPALQAFWHHLSELREPAAN